MTVVAYNILKIQCNTCHQMASLAFRLYKIRLGPRWEFATLRQTP